ncbi:MAG: hypothetical protein HZA20_12450 [Nitrospirae bacterium]|nr:hypothetical protein [Nitrospirota bacterium]
MRLSTFFLLALVISSGCAGVQHRGGVPAPLVAGVSARPGAVAWSPDGERLAVIKGGDLVVLDAASGRSSTIGDVDPVFVDWSPGDDLLVVGNDGGKRLLFTMSADLSRRATLKTIDRPDAAMWISSPELPESIGTSGSYAVLSAAADESRIGTFVTYRLEYAEEPGNGRIILAHRAYSPERKVPADYLVGWTHNPVRPVHETLLTPRFRKPPAFPPVTLFATVDPVTGEESELFELSGRRFSVPASWSPDGSRLALTDDAGRLIVYATGSGAYPEPAAGEALGLYPSWNPVGSLIYLGGLLVDPAGNTVRRLISDDPASIGVWSPDGASLAVVTGKGLYIFSGIAPSTAFDKTALALRGKLRLLRRLYKDSLVTGDEYRERKRMLLEGGMTE